MVDEQLQGITKQRLRFTRKITDSLITDGISELSMAKAVHDRLEAIYNPYVNFEGVCAAADRLAEEILK